MKILFSSFVALPNFKMGVSKMFVRVFQENRDLKGLRVEEKWCKSISSGAQYVILKSKIG
jgi:hypothetical protein